LPAKEAASTGALSFPMMELVYLSIEKNDVICNNGIKRVRMRRIEVQLNCDLICDSRFNFLFWKTSEVKAVSSWEMEEASDEKKNRRKSLQHINKHNTTKVNSIE